MERVITLKKLGVIILLTLILAGCQSKESGTELVNSSISITAAASREDYSGSQNDLVYHDYGDGLELSANAKLTIAYLDLELKNESAVIYIVNLKDNKIIKQFDYKPKEVITYTSESGGIYMIIAVIDNDRIVDITSKAVIETNYTTTGNDDKFILLQ